MNRLLTFSHTSHDLEQEFFPPIYLDVEKNYGIALYSLTMYNSLPNVAEGRNNSINFIPDVTKVLNGPGVIVELPGGRSFTLADIQAVVRSRLRQTKTTIGAFELSFHTNKRCLFLRTNKLLILPDGSPLREFGFPKFLFPGSYYSEMKLEGSPILEAPSLGGYLLKACEAPVGITISLPTGFYTFEQLATALEKAFDEKKVTFVLTKDPITSRLTMESSAYIYFSTHSLQERLGFTRLYYTPLTKHVSETLPQLQSFETIHVECNLVEHSYQNGKRSQRLYSFTPIGPSGYKISECPQNLLFLPTNQRVITHVGLRLTDQTGQPLSLYHEELIISLVLRELP